MGMEIKVINTNLVNDLAQIIDNAKDQTKPMKKAAQTMIADVQRHFNDEQGSDRPWPELSPLTLYGRRHRKSKKTFSTQILKDIGTLRQSIKSFADKDMAMVSSCFISNQKGRGKA
jgi:phage gpG-like protein